jgi:hypothetical protein
MEVARPPAGDAGETASVVLPADAGAGADGELRQARLTNAYLRARLSFLEQAQRRLEEKSEVLESELLRVSRQLSAALEDLAAERAVRRRTEDELRKARGAQGLERADLAVAGWRVERERRVRAEAEAARLGATAEELRTAVASELEQLTGLVGRWRQAAVAGPAAPSGPEPSAAERDGRAPRRRRLFRSHGREPAPEATPAGLLLARALELAAGEVEATAAARQLVELADGDAQAVEDAIARADRVMWEASGMATDPEFAVEVTGRMPVWVAGASTLLSAALQRMREHPPTHRTTT